MQNHNYKASIKAKKKALSLMVRTPGSSESDDVSEIQHRMVIQPAQTLVRQGRQNRSTQTSTPGSSKTQVIWFASVTDLERQICVLVLTSQHRFRVLLFCCPGSADFFVLNRYFKKEKKENNLSRPYVMIFYCECWLNIVSDT